MPDPFSCPRCGTRETAVVDSRPSDMIGRGGVACPNIRRRRECTTCGARFTTRETEENLDQRDVIDLSTMSAEHRETMRRLARALSKPQPGSPGHA